MIFVFFGRVTRFDANFGCFWLFVKTIVRKRILYSGNTLLSHLKSQPKNPSDSSTRRNIFDTSIDCQYTQFQNYTSKYIFLYNFFFHILLAVKMTCRILLGLFTFWSWNLFMAICNFLLLFPKILKINLFIFENYIYDATAADACCQRNHEEINQPSRKVGSAHQLEHSAPCSVHSAHAQHWAEQF